MLAACGSTQCRVSSRRLATSRCIWLPSFITSLNIAYEEEEKRGFIGVNLLALAMTAATVVAAVIAMVAIAALGHLETLLAGLPGFVIYGWQGVLVPTGTPADVVARLSTEIAKALADPGLKARLTAQGTEPAYMPADEFGRFIATEQKRWGDVVRKAGITVD